jgi:hypothetical protein
MSLEKLWLKVSKKSKIIFSFLKEKLRFIYYIYTKNFYKVKSKEKKG